MKISLTPELENLIQEHVKYGKFDTASEVVCEALNLLRQRDLLAQDYDEWLKAQIELGWQQAERGNVEPHSMKSVVDEVLAKANA